MMKNLRKSTLISLVLILAILLIFTKSVNASGGLLAGVGANQTETNGTPLTGNTASNVTANTTVNTTMNVVANTVETPNNVQKVNNINDASKDIPQTGENDIYMITVIGMVAIVIGGIAFVKSKKYDI